MKTQHTLGPWVAQIGARHIEVETDDWIITETDTHKSDSPPLWGCQHNWMLIGSPIVTWTSSGTGDKPPENAPAMQKRQCLNCGGFEWIGV